MEQREITLQQLDSDLSYTKKQYQDAIEENGRLEARIQAFAINAQSEQDILSGEVKRREDYIQKLKMEHMTKNETISKLEEKVSQSERVVEQQQSQLKNVQTEVGVL